MKKLLSEKFVKQSFALQKEAKQLLDEAAKKVKAAII